MTTITAKIIADSIANDIRITTMELEFPRFILPQFNTHRMFSRNAASSRAIPVTRNIEAVQSNPAMPIHWGKNQAGMQAKEEWSGKLFVPAMGQQGSYESSDPAEYWRYAAYDSTRWATRYMEAELHKQIVNRLLEPFLHTKVIVTSTEWDNFFKLRLHDDAQPEIQELARQMKKALDNSQPYGLLSRGWHLPYVSFDERYDKQLMVEDAIKCSVARCARVSYNNHDGSSPDIAKDLELYDKLLKAGHMSPTEHQATPMKYPVLAPSPNLWAVLDKGYTHMSSDKNMWSNNFRGWVQHRAMIDV